MLDAVVVDIAVRLSVRSCTCLMPLWLMSLSVCPSDPVRAGEDPHHHLSAAGDAARGDLPEAVP